MNVRRLIVTFVYTAVLYPVVKWYLNNPITFVFMVLGFIIGTIYIRHS